MKYDKLIRDKIPEIIRAKGGTPLTHVAKDAEYWDKLKAKLSEEVDEFKIDDNVEELADILEVIDAIKAFKGFKPEDIQKVQNQKRIERGGFRKRIILDES